MNRERVREIAESTLPPQTYLPEQREAIEVLRRQAVMRVESAILQFAREFGEDMCKLFESGCNSETDNPNDCHRSDADCVRAALAELEK